MLSQNTRYMSSTRRAFGDGIAGMTRKAPLDTAGAAEYLGTSVRHVRRLVFDRRVPFTRVGGKIRFLPADLDQYLKDRRVRALT